MKKSLKNVIAGVLMVSMLVIGAAFVSPEFSAASPVVEECTGIGCGASSAKGEGQSETLFGDEGVFKTITNAALYLIGAISVIMLIYGGIRYTISGGDSANVTSAKNTILYAIVGIIVAILAYAIVNWVIGQLITTP